MDSIFEKLDFWADKNPEKLLYSFLDIDGNVVEKYSYREFIQRTNIIAANLHKNYKFKKNDRILLAYPPGLEVICAFFACARLGLIPVPVYPPTSHGFQSALYKITYISKDCQAAAVLTSKDYYWSIKLNLARNSVSKFSLKKNYISTLKWIVTEDLRDMGSSPTALYNYADILFLQYTSGSTSHPKGVIVTHKNILHNSDLIYDPLPTGVSWLPQYHDMGLIGYYLFSVLKGGTTYGFSPLDFIENPGLWLQTITKYKATASSAPNFAYEYCLRPGKISKETMESLDLSSLRFLMTAAEPVRANIYFRFLETFKKYGLNPESFITAYGLAENTLAVSSYGRKVISASKKSLKLNKLKIAEDEAVPATQIMSCGKPLGNIIVKIVDKEKHIALQDGDVGEIWVNGDSKCSGYWNNPELTKKIFQASIVGENHQENKYMRTGDIGFIHEEELYVCGRTKDLIIIRGLNYYPHDIEKIVEESSPLIRKGCIAAFDIHEDDEEKLVVVAEIKSAKATPDPLKIAAEIRKYLNITPHTIDFIAPRTIPKTSSGKIIRHQAKQNWLENKFNIIKHFAGHVHANQCAETIASSPFEALKAQYNLTGNEACSLIDAGLDSLDLVVLMHDLKELLKEKGANILAKEIDIRLIQQITVSELFELAEQFENSSAAAILQLKHLIVRLQKEHAINEKNIMRQDVHLTFKPEKPAYDVVRKKHKNILLTGGTGFFGPFIIKSLLEQTDENIYVIIRAANELDGKERLRLAMRSIDDFTPELTELFDERVFPVCGDLGKAHLGLSEERWDYLSNNIETIYHNGATVNYLFTYEKMRGTNVTGTNEVLKLAFQGHPKTFNHISTTFIFGWATKDTLFETDNNADMELLDFGYSQTKWVSERIVMDAMKHGLKVRIFRPALITPSVNGGGNNFDISIRLLSFMVNNGITVDAHNQVSFTPADVAANNIVAISNLPDTVNKSFHVTRDHYASMLDITNIIKQLTGQQFKVHKLPQFVPSVIERCTKEDLLFPLLDFLVRSVDNISSMEFKRYDSSNYQQARNRSAFGKQDPSLEDTVTGIMLFMQKKEIIPVNKKFLTEAVSMVNG
ncbi:MAG: fatty acyl-AMP ligase [Ginsengibacter sp.]